MKENQNNIGKTMDDIFESITKDWDKLKLDFKKMSKEDKKKLQERIDLKAANLAMLREKRYTGQKRITGYRSDVPMNKEELYDLID